MTKIDELFNQAYQMHVLEEKNDEAIKLCRQALVLDPFNYRVRVFLGILLGDSSNSQDKLEARQHFVQAIKSATNADQIFTDWPEEAVIHHLGIWELNRGAEQNACLFFLIDSMTSRNKVSLEYATKLLEKLYPDISSDVRLILNCVMRISNSREKIVVKE